MNWIKRLAFLLFSFSYLFSQCFDQNSDGLVTLEDIRIISSGWPCQLGNACYLSTYDVDSNGIVNLLDILEVGQGYWTQACCPALPSPQNVLAATGSLPGSIDVSWSAVANAEGYQVLLGTQQGGPYDLVRDVGYVIQSSITGLQAGTDYYLVVVAYDVCGLGIQPSEQTAIAQAEALVDTVFQDQYSDLIPPDADPDAYDSSRFSLITGLVIDKDSFPVSGVTVSLIGYPEFGTVSSEADGSFTLPLNGGGPFDVLFSDSRFIEVQRLVGVGWNEIAVVEPVMLIGPDPVSTVVSFDGNPNTVVTHKSSVTTDSFGSRSCHIVFTGDNMARSVDPEGRTIEQLSNVTVRATEFSQRESMPSDLPPNSAYTYCVEQAIDGAASVVFDKPVVSWVENFLGFDVGEAVPLGFFDRDNEAWVPGDNGIVVKLLDMDMNGVVDALDADGDDLPDDLNTSGSTADEVLGLDNPSDYPPNATFWRFEVSHFTPWDCNWPYGFPGGEIVPNPPGACKDCTTIKIPCISKPGSYVEDRRRVFHDEVEIPGTNYVLHYASNRVEGFKTKITIPASGDTVNPSLESIQVRMKLAGQLFEAILPGSANQQAEFLWDGTDHLGNEVLYGAKAEIRIGFVYEAVYYSSNENWQQSFAQAGDTVTGIRARQELISWVEYAQDVFVPNREATSFGAGWSLAHHHTLRPGDWSTMFKGDGGTLSNNLLAIETYAGDGTYGYSGDGGSALEASIAHPQDIIVDTSGALYFSDQDNHVIRRVSPSGIISTYAGNGARGMAEEYTRATQSPVDYPKGLAIDVEGNLYFAEFWNCRIRKIDAEGIVTNVAGGGHLDPASADGGPATDARLYGPIGIDIDSWGTLYIADAEGHRIRKVSPGGIITTVVGTGSPGFSGDDGAALTAEINYPTSISTDSSGNLYFTDKGNYRIRCIDLSGIITTVAGTGIPGLSGDGGPAVAAQLKNPIDLIAKDGNRFWFVDQDRVRFVDQQGSIYTIAGGGQPGNLGDDGAPTLAYLDQPTAVGLDAGDQLFIADSHANRIRAVSFPTAVKLATASGLLVFTEDTGLGYALTPGGLHRETFDLYSGRVLNAFSYDGSDRLVECVDRSGNLTQIERPNPTTVVITAPFGQTTTLTLDGSQQLIAIQWPDSSSYNFEYDGSGLLTAKTNPAGHRFDYTYDLSGRLTDVEDQIGGHIMYAETASGSTVTWAPGVETEYEDAVPFSGGFASTITLPSGVQSELSRSEDGLTTTMNPPCNCSTHITTVQDVNPEFQYTFQKEHHTKVSSGVTLSRIRTSHFSDSDMNGDLDQFQDQYAIAGHTWTRNRDLIQSQEQLTTPQGRVYKSHLDPTTQLVTQIDLPSAYPFLFSYDAFGRLTSISRDDGMAPKSNPTRGPPSRSKRTLVRTLTYEYGSDGFVEKIIDPASTELDIGRNSLGHITSLTLATNGTLHFGRDSLGQITSLTQPEGQVYTFTYSPHGMVTSNVAPDVGGASSTTTFTYNDFRKPELITYPDGRTVSYGYSADQLTTLTTDAGAYTFSYTSDTGQVETISDPDGGQLDFSYDGNLVTETEWTGNVVGSVQTGYSSEFWIDSHSINYGNQISYDYDADGLITQAKDLSLTRDAVNGFVTGTTLFDIAETFGFDGFLSMDNYEVTFQGSTVYEQQFTFDLAGRIASIQETIGGTQTLYEYNYDDLGQITEVRVDSVPTYSYGYDLNGNHSNYNGLAGTYDDQDRLTQLATTTFSYTDNGDLTSKVENGTDTTVYEYDAIGNLRSVTLPSSQEITYIIDGQNRRVGKEVDGTPVQGFLYKDALNPIAELDGTKQVVSTFIYAEKPFVPSYMVKDGQSYKIVSDQVGSVRLVINTTTGIVAQRMDYDPFGNVLVDSNPGFQPFGFQGGLYDPDTGLTRFGARDYSPEMGRWTCKDPLGIFGGEASLYRFNGNNPLHTIDPTGQGAKETVSGTVKIGAGILGFIGTVAMAAAIANPVGAAAVIMIGSVAAVSSIVSGGSELVTQERQPDVWNDLIIEKLAETIARRCGAGEKAVYVIKKATGAIVGVVSPGDATASALNTATGLIMDADDAMKAAGY